MMLSSQIATLTDHYTSQMNKKWQVSLNVPPRLLEAPPTHRNRKYDVFVSSEVSNMAVERNSLLRCSGLTDSQRHTQDSVSTKLSCRERQVRQRPRDRQVRQRHRQTGQTCRVVHLFSVPSNSNMNLSIFSCSTTLKFLRDRQQRDRQADKEKTLINSLNQRDRLDRKSVV